MNQLRLLIGFCVVLDIGLSAVLTKTARQGFCMVRAIQSLHKDSEPSHFQIIIHCHWANKLAQKEKKKKTEDC